MELLTSRLQFQNKFLHDLISVVKSLVRSKSCCNWETLVKEEKKCILKLPHRETLEETEEKFYLIDINCNVIGIDKLLK